MRKRRWKTPSNGCKSKANQNAPKRSERFFCRFIFCGANRCTVAIAAAPFCPHKRSGRRRRTYIYIFVLRKRNFEGIGGAFGGKKSIRMLFLVTISRDRQGQRTVNFIAMSLTYSVPSPFLPVVFTYVPPTPPYSGRVLCPTSSITPSVRKVTARQA